MELLNTFLQRSDALNGYWNLYIAVSLGVLGLMASGKPFTKLTKTKMLLTIGFLIFAGSNLWAMLSTNQQRMDLKQLIDPKYTAVVESASPPKHSQLIIFHGVLDLLVILSLWFVPWQDSGDGN